MKALEKDGNGGYHVPTKTIISVITTIVIVLLALGGTAWKVSSFAATNRSDIINNSEDIDEIKDDYVSKTEFQYIKDSLDEMKSDIKDIKEKQYGGER